MRRGRNTHKALAAVAIVLFASAACSKPRPAVYTQSAIVKVESDPEKPLSGAKVSINGQPAAVTGKNGMAAVQVRGVAGERFEIDVACPEGHLAAAPRGLEVYVRATKSVSKKPAFAVRCAPSIRTALITVKTDLGAGLPVMYLGRQVAKTDAKGKAQVMLEVAPAEAFELTLDTGERSDIHPQNPTASFPMENKDEMFTFEQKFTVDKKAAPRRRAPRVAKKLGG